MRAPPLSPQQNAEWPELRDAWARRLGAVHGKAVGAYFIGRVNAVLIGLGKHLAGGASMKHSTTTGDNLAFVKFLAEMKKTAPAPMAAIVI